MKLTSDDAFELAKMFRDLSVTIGDFRFQHWDDLTAAQRRRLEDEEWSLLNAASDMVTKAIGLILDETEASVGKIQASARAAQKAVKTLKTVRKVINIATAAVGLAAAIISKDAGAIGRNAKALYDAATV